MHRFLRVESLEYENLESLKSGFSNVWQLQNTAPAFRLDVFGKMRIRGKLILWVPICCGYRGNMILDWPHFFFFFKCRLFVFRRPDTKFPRRKYGAHGSSSNCDALYLGLMWFLSPRGWTQSSRKIVLEAIKKKKKKCIQSLQEQWLIWLGKRARFFKWLKLARVRFGASWCRFWGNVCSIPPQGRSNTAQLFSVEMQM